MFQFNRAPVFKELSRLDPLRLFSSLPRGLQRSKCGLRQQSPEIKMFPSLIFRYRSHV